MSNTLEFILKLQDMLTPGMRQAAAISNTASAQIQNQFNAVQGSSRRMTASVDELRQRLNAVNQVRFSTTLVNEFNTATRAAQRLERQIADLEGRGKSGGGGGGGMLGNIIGGNLIAGFLQQGVGMIGGAITGTIGKAMEFGSTQKSFEVLTGSAAKGNALSGDLNKLQRDTILGPEVFQNAQTMMGFGIQTEKVIPTLKMLGDVSMGNKEKLNALTLAYSQVQAAGKLSGQDLLQFINAGFNPLNEISKQTGLSIGKLKDMMGEGAISADMITKAFESATAEGGLYNNMLNKLAETPAGKMAQLEGAFEGFKVKMGEALMPLASVAMSALSSLLEIANSIIPYIVEGVSYIANLFTGVNNTTNEWSVWLNVVQSYLGVMWGVIQSIAANIWHIISGVIKWVQQSELMQDIFWLVGKGLEGIWWVVGNIGDALSWIWDNVLKPILDGIDYVYGKMKRFLVGQKVQIEGTVDTPAGAKVPDNLKFTKTSFTDPIAATGAGGAKPADNTKTITAGKDKAEAINGGGQKSIVINIGKQIEKLEMHVMNGRESAEEIGSLVTEHLRRALYSINGAVS